MRFQFVVNNSNNKLPTGSWTPGNCPAWICPSSRQAPSQSNDARGHFWSGDSNYEASSNLITGVSHNYSDFVQDDTSATAGSRKIVWTQAGGSYTFKSGTKWYLRVRVKKGWKLSYKDYSFTAGMMPGAPSNISVGSTSCSIKSTQNSYNEYEFSFATSGEFMAGGATQGNITCNLNLAPETYTVTYNYNGSGQSNTTASSTGGSAVTLPSPTRTGYSFDGWYTAASGGSLVGAGGASYTPSSNVTLYARWSPIKYTIAFNGNGATSGSTSSIVATYGTSYTLTSNGFSNSNGKKVSFNGNGGSAPSTITSTLYFNNWNTKADGTGTSYSDMASVKNLRSTAGTVTLYAQWKSNAISLPSSTRVGYTLNGWYTAASGGTKVGGSGGSYTPTADITLYAQWTQQTYTITFNSNGGSTPNPSTKGVTYGSTYGSLPTVTRTGYTFAGWYTATSGGSKIESSTKVTITSAQTLYARWTANKYTVSFNANGGSVSSTSTTVTYNSAYGTLPTPTRAQYNFVGWYTASSGGSQVTATTIVSTASNHTLYARWAIGKYTIKFNGNGATSGNMSDQTFTFGVAQRLSANTYVKHDSTYNFDYDFLGWSKSSSATTATYVDNQSVENIASSVDETVTLYAVWRKKTIVTVRSNDPNLGTVNNVTGYYSVGAKVTLVATIKDSTEIKFLGWYLGDTKQSGSASYEITVGASDVTYVAKFRSIVHTLHVTDPSVGGDVTLVVEGESVELIKDVGVSVEVREGQTVELIATADYNYDVDGWTVTEDGSSVFTGGNYKSFSVTSSNSYEIFAAPQFTEKPKFTVTVSKSGRGKDSGVIKLVDAYGHEWAESSGRIIAEVYVGLTYTATASVQSDVSHILFEGWYSDGSVIETDNILTIRQSEEQDVSVVADFKNTYHTLNVSSTDAKHCYLEAWSGETQLDLTGAVVADGQYITVKATPSVLRNFDKWQISNNDDNINKEVIFQVNESMGDVVEAKAIVSSKGTDTLLATKENGEYGGISVFYEDCIDTSTGELKDVEVVFTEDSQGEIQATIYNGVEYTATATLAENLSEAGRQLSFFAGWYHEIGSDWVLQTTDLEESFQDVSRIEARFAAFALHGVMATVTSGEGDVAFDYGHNPADINGEVPQWIEGQSVKIVATSAQGYEFKSFSVKNLTTGTVTRVTDSHVFIITGINASYEIEVAFSKIKCPVVYGVDEYSSFAGEVSATVDGVPEPDFSDLYYGDTVSFTATSNSGYSFGGWYVGGEKVSDDAVYAVTLTTPLDIKAKFKAVVTLKKASSVSAAGNVFLTTAFDDSGEPVGWLQDDGTSVAVWVTLGDYCAVKAESTAGVFGAWHDELDTSFDNPLDIADNDTFRVLSTTTYIGRFISEDDYLYIALFNDWFDPSEADTSVILGILSMTSGEPVTEDEYNEGIANNGYTGKPVTGAYIYYRFLGSRKSALKAVDNSGRVFHHWERSMLVDGAFSDPAEFSEDDELSVNTNRNYIFTAFWGTPKPVNVMISLLEESRGLGTLRMDSETEERVETDISISDMLMQGVTVTIAADAKNGYKFVGWYEDATGNILHSREQNLSFEVRYAISLFAKFEEDRNAIYRWEGARMLKSLRWKSKVYVSSKPFDPVCARVDATGYSVGLKVGLFSSPDAQETQIKDIEVTSQNARRLPRSRPERFCQIEVNADNDINAIFVGTNMQELAI